MSHRIRRHLSFANVTALLALVLAMGGISYALTIPKNSVGGAQIKKNAVTSKKVKDRSLLGADFAAGQLPAGPQGAQGPAGPGGPAGTFGAITVERADFTVGASLGTSIDVPCPAGTKAIGGGSDLALGAAPDIDLIASRPFNESPVPDPPGAGSSFANWKITYRNPGGGAGGAASAFAICAQG
ncbi:MAG: hypothetical protein ABIZ50_02625 [Solirubrobacterales bacterium]